MENLLKENEHLKQKLAVAHKLLTGWITEYGLVPGKQARQIYLKQFSEHQKNKPRIGSKKELR